MAVRHAKRKTVWVGTATVARIAVASATKVIHSSFAPDDLAMLAPTVARVRGIFNVFPTAFSVDLNWTGALGLCIVSDEAFAAGVASIPGPHNEDDWGGWIVHQYFGGHFDADVDGNTLCDTMYTIDSKAMRKVEINETLVWVVQSTTGAFTIDLNARVLMMLS